MSWIRHIGFLVVFVLVSGIAVGQTFDPNDCPRGPMIRIPITSLTKAISADFMVLTDSCGNQYYTHKDSVTTKGGVINQYYAGDTLITITQGDTFITIIQGDTTGIGRFRWDDNLGAFDTTYTYPAGTPTDNIRVTNGLNIDAGDPIELKWGGVLIEDTDIDGANYTFNIKWDSINLIRTYANSNRFYPKQSFLVQSDNSPTMYIQLSTPTSMYLRADTVMHLDLYNHGLSDTSHLLIRTDRARDASWVKGGFLQLLRTTSGIHQGEADWSLYALPLTAPASTGNYSLNYSTGSKTFSFSSIPTSPTGGSGTLNYVAKWTPDGNTLGDSQIFDDGTYVGIGTASPGYRLTVAGEAQIKGKGIFTQTTPLSSTVIDASLHTQHKIYTNNLASNLSIGTYLSEKQIYLKTTGEVGINHTAPSAAIDVKGFGKTSATYSEKWKDSDATEYGWARDDGLFYNFNLAVGGTSLQTGSELTVNGNFYASLNSGIGTSINSDYMLDVKSQNINGKTAIRGRTDVNGIGGYFLSMSDAGTETNPILKVVANSSNFGDTGYAPLALFQVGSDSATVISKDGRIGIHTVLPVQDLHVQGTARITGSDGTATTIMGRDGDGDISAITVGSGLSFTSGTLTADPALTGSGTTNYVTKWTPDGNTLGDSQIFDNGTNVGINNAAPGALLDLIGNGNDNSTYTQFWNNSDATTGWARDDGLFYFGLGTFGGTSTAAGVELTVNGNARITGSDGTATTIMGRDADGDISAITIGSGLSFAAGELSATGGGVTGSGTLNYVAKWTPDGITLGDSQIQDDGTGVGINTAPIANTQLAVFSANLPIYGYSTNTTNAKVAVFWGNAGAAATSPLLDVKALNSAFGNTGFAPLAQFSTQGDSLTVISKDGRIGIHTAIPPRDLTVVGTARITGSDGTATTITGRDGDGDISNVGVGAGLSLSGGTLSATGGGLPFEDITPDAMVGVNAAGDTLTGIQISYFDNPDTTGFWVSNTRLQNDTIYSLRGSYFNGYETADWAKSLGAGVVDTLNIDPDGEEFDFTEAAGRYTYVQPAQYLDEYVFDWHWEHRFTISANVSLNADAAGDVELSVYYDGVQLQGCVAETYLDASSHSVTIPISCQAWIYDGTVLDVRLKNSTAGTVNYSIRKASFHAEHLKSRIRPAF
ncbi:MAG: hypothetical protein K9I85_06025 [Saprospiraceae bacterium]|nr:hypothetical protein [Saprospiraceae bacterium]